MVRDRPEPRVNVEQTIILLSKLCCFIYNILRHRLIVCATIIFAGSIRTLILISNVFIDNKSDSDKRNFPVSDVGLQDEFSIINKNKFLRIRLNSV